MAVSPATIIALAKEHYAASWIQDAIVDAETCDNPKTRKDALSFLRTKLENDGHLAPKKRVQPWGEDRAVIIQLDEMGLLDQY